MIADMERHRGKDSEIDRKHCDITIRTLRKIYGSSFAQHAEAEDKLSDVLAQLDASSLTELVWHHEEGTLEERVKKAES